MLVVFTIFGIFLVSVCVGAEITDIKYGESVDALRLEVSASEYLSVQAFIVDDQNRLVIKFPGSRISGTLSQPSHDHPLFSGVASTSEVNGDLRLVVDLKRPATFTQFWEPASYGSSPKLLVQFPKRPMSERAGKSPRFKNAGKPGASLMSPTEKATGKTANYGEIEQLRRALAEQQRLLDEQKKAFEEQQRKLRTLQNQLEHLAGAAPAKRTDKSRTMEQTNRTDAGSASPRKVAGNRQPSRPTGPVGQAPDPAETAKTPELPRISETVGGVLTPKGNLTLEPSLEYHYASNNRVFLNSATFAPAVAVGLIDIANLDRHTLLAALTARYGLSDRFEVSARVPVLYREDRQRSRPISVNVNADETFDIEGSGLGDIELTARYQLNGGSGGWPIFVANLATTLPSGRSPYDIDYVVVPGIPGATYPTELPTGSGYVSVQPSITALYPTDPAVFYGNLSYAYNVETDEDFETSDGTEKRRVEPGDAIGASFGLGFSINERSSFSIGYSHKHVFGTEVGGKSLKGSNLDLGEFLLGYSFKLTRDTSLNLSVSIGATEDAQDAKVTLRLPMSFRPFN